MQPLNNILVYPCIWYEIVDQELIVRHNKIIDLNNQHRVGLRKYHLLRMTLEQTVITTTTLQAIRIGSMPFQLPKSEDFTVYKK